MWYVCSKLTPLWLDHTCLCLTTIISLSKTKFTVLAATFHLERLGASFTMNIKMQWKESEPTSEPHVASVICALLMHESGPGLYTQVRWCRWTFRSCWTFGTVYKGNTGNLLQWLHQAPCSYSGVSWILNQSKGFPKGPQVSAHLDALCFSPYQQFNDIPYPSLPHYTQKSAPSPLSRLGGGGHISSDWQQQQLRLRGVRTAADRQQMAPTYEPPISQSQSEPNAKIRKKQEWCKDTGELQKVTIFSADPEPSAARHGNTSLGCYAHYCSDLILDNTLF